MAFLTKQGPHRREVLIFDLEDLPQVRLDSGSGTGLVFIDKEGKIHFEINNLRIFAGNFLEMIFRPERYFRKLGAVIASFSLLKEKSRLLGGLAFFFNAKRREIRWSGTALLPWEELPPEVHPIRKVALTRLLEALDAMAVKLTAVRGIGATDRIPPEKIAPLGWYPYHPTSWWENLKIHLYELPLWPRQLYEKKWE